LSTYVYRTCCSAYHHPLPVTCLLLLFFLLNLFLISALSFVRVQSKDTSAEDSRLSETDPGSSGGLDATVASKVSDGGNTTGGSSHQARPENMPACITVDLAACTITPQLQLDKRSHVTSKGGKQFLKFTTWSTHSQNHPTQRRTVHFSNQSCATLTFNLESTAPSFAIASARSSAPKHPLSKVR